VSVLWLKHLNQNLSNLTLLTTLLLLLKMDIVYFLSFFGITLNSKRFRAHRLGGIFLIITYLFAWFAYFYDYENIFIKYCAPLWPALAGLFQATSASFTFTYLPKMRNSGVLSRDKGNLSYHFIVENSFFQMLIVFWYSHYLFKFELEKFFFGKFFVLIFTFLPFTIIRPFFPLTTFSYDPNDAHIQKKKDPKNAKEVYSLPTYAVFGMRWAYMIFKHVMYFGFNYRCFISNSDPESHDLFMKQSWPILLSFVGGCNWVIFQHTLVLRKIVTPWIAEAPLGIIISLTILYLPRTFGTFLTHDPSQPLLFALIGIAMNVLPFYSRLPKQFIHLHYMMSMIFFISLREDTKYDWRSVLQISMG